MISPSMEADAELADLSPAELLREEVAVLALANKAVKPSKAKGKKL